MFFLVGWVISTLVLVGFFGQSIAASWWVVICPFCLCSELPSYLQVISLVIGITPLCTLLLVMFRPQVPALVVWAYGTVLVYWLWALFLMGARCLAG